MKKRTEKDLQKAILDLLGYHRITAIVSRMDQRTSNNVGCPDFLFAVKGQAVAWEAKIPGKKCTLGQFLMHRRLIEDGWHIAIIHCIEEAIRELDLLVRATSD